MTARITEVRDAVAARITAAWAPAAPNEVIKKTRIDPKLSEATGRKVCVFRSQWAKTPIDRGEDQGDYTIAVMVTERYEPAGDPPESWVDERVEWCEWLLEDVLGDARGERLLATPGEPDSGLWPETAEVTTVHDLEELAEKKLFVSVLSITYREHSEHSEA